MKKRFPYENVKTPYPIVRRLIEAIGNLPNRDWSNTIWDANYAVHALGKEAGFVWIRTSEERAVATALKQIYCGPRTAHYGWRLYARYRKGGLTTPLNISY